MKDMLELLPGLIERFNELEARVAGLESRAPSAPRVWGEPVVRHVKDFEAVSDPGAIFGGGGVLVGVADALGFYDPWPKSIRILENDGRLRCDVDVCPPDQGEQRVHVPGVGLARMVSYQDATGDFWVRVVQQP